MTTLARKVRESVKKAAVNEDGRAVPYVIAWFLGIPAGLLFLIWLLRGQ